MNRCFIKPGDFIFYDHGVLTTMLVFSVNLEVGYSVMVLESNGLFKTYWWRNENHFRSQLLRIL